MEPDLKSRQRTFDLALRDSTLEPALINLLACQDSDAARRVGLYRGNVRARWRSALASAYQVILALVGQTYFDALALAYVRERPSQSGDLNNFGAGLPEFIGRYEQDARFRYFPDVARLEWALHVACFAADVVPFTAQQWSEARGEALLNARLKINPACTAITSQYAVADIWLAHQPGGIFPECIDLPIWTLVVRPLWKPTIVAHSAAAHAAFVSLQCGHTLDEALDAAYDIDPRFDFASQLQTWIATSAITGVIL